ncbi:uncharacterized protein LOC123680632 [Harmonia axyridis]|uniref:uncharacterized protein LOC123680632 n=1 Tax=Harmonia axyridis TaxID=115357 RepID=UPI001E276D09|nr:uncharacterized protein LOC123680632 [Harmonia axyridis]
MPPQPKRNRCVILYDLNCKNQRQLRRALFKIYSHHYFDDSKDLVNLVLVNCEKTKNRKNQEFGKDFENIFEVNREERLYDPTFIHDKIEVKHTDGAHWKEAINVAVQILKEDNTPRIITYQILFLTDLINLSSVKGNIDNIVQELNVNNIFLYIVGPEIESSTTLTSFADSKLLYADFSIDSKNEVLIEASRLVEKSKNAVIANVEMGLQFFFNYQNPIGKQPWTVPLTVGSKIEYSVETTKLMETNFGYQLECEDQKPDPSVFISMEDSTRIYAEEDIRKGILRHAKFVPLSSNDIFNEKEERMFSLVFITKVEHIPEYMLTGPGCYTVTASDKSPTASFDALVLRLHALQSCLIAKRVYAEGNSPIYMALLPCPSKKWLLAVELPYGSDVPFEWLEQKPQKDEIEVAEPVLNFLDSITVGSKNFSLKCPMTPNVVSSSEGEALVNLATEKLLQEPNMRLEEVDHDPFSTNINADIGKSLREMWPSQVYNENEDEEDFKEEDDDESDNEDVDYF